MKLRGLFLFLVLFSLPAFAQTDGTIHVKKIDADTGKFIMPDTTKFIVSSYPGLISVNFGGITSALNQRGLQAGTISAQKLAAIDSLLVTPRFTNVVVSYIVSIQVDGVYKEFKQNGAKLDADTKAALAKLKSGTRFFVMNFVIRDRNSRQTISYSSGLPGIIVSIE